MKVLVCTSADIIRDDGTAATVVASAMSVDGYDHASNGVYIECSAGNTVYVRVTIPNTNRWCNNTTSAQLTENRDLLLCTFSILHVHVFRVEHLVDECTERPD